MTSLGVSSGCPGCGGHLFMTARDGIGRPVLACVACGSVVLAPAPESPDDRCRARSSRPARRLGT